MSTGLNVIFQRISWLKQRFRVPDIGNYKLFLKNQYIVSKSIYKNTPTTSLWNKTMSWMVHVLFFRFWYDVTWAESVLEMDALPLSYWVLFFTFITRPKFFFCFMFKRNAETNFTETLQKRKKHVKCSAKMLVFVLIAYTWGVCFIMSLRF